MLESMVSAAAPAQPVADDAVVVLPSGIAEIDVEKRPYASYVAECLDLLMSHGTDRYGRVQKPLLVTILDVRSRACPESPPERSAPWRGQWRTCFWKPRGSDLLVDQSTVEVFYLMAKLRGQTRYAQFADRYQRAVLELTDEKGFFWWGWHRFYDVFDDVPSGSHGNSHEIHVNLPRWNPLWQIDPAATQRELEAIWQWHVIDKRTGEHNRHGDGQRGCDFAMSGGEFVYALAFLSQKTGQPVWLQRAELVADYHWRSRNPVTGLVPNQPSAGAKRFDGSHFDTSISGLLCYNLLKAYELTGVEKFRDQALTYLRGYAKHGYDPASGRFWGSLRLDGTPEPGPRTVGGYSQYEPRGLIDLWQPYQLGYEHPLATAQCYAYAYHLTGDAGMLAAAQEWADCIRRAPPSRGCQEKQAWYADYARRFAPHGTFADLYGRTISLFVHLYALTGQQAYLDDARSTAREAVAKLYYQGLFRGHPAKPFYSSVDGVGFLLYGLVQLDVVLKQPKTVVGAKAIPLGVGEGTMGFDNW
jgi:hypothetical protein